MAKILEERKGKRHIICEGIDEELKMKRLDWYARRKDAEPTDVDLPLCMGRGWKEILVDRKTATSQQLK